MKIITEGHKYVLENYEHPELYGQTLQFIEKQQDANGNFVTVHDGTTNEEVLVMLIDRLKVLGEKLPCRENSVAITKCEEALMWLNRRTLERRSRGVEGTWKP